MPSATASWGVLWHPDCAVRAGRAPQGEGGTVLTGLGSSGSFPCARHNSTDLPDFANLVAYLCCRMGGGSRPLRVSSFSSGPFVWVFWEFVACLFTWSYLLSELHRGESEIWLQKVIWQFIFRAALLPAACFKLNLWHQDIHHFNCMLLFSQAQICLIFFFFSPVVWGGVPPHTPHPPLKKKKSLTSPDQALFIIKRVFNTEITGGFFAFVLFSVLHIWFLTFQKQKC